MPTVNDHPTPMPGGTVHVTAVWLMRAGLAQGAGLARTMAGG